MGLQVLRQGATQLPRSVAVNQPYRALVAERCRVQKFLDSRNRFLGRATKEIQFRAGSFTWLQLHVHADLGRGRRAFNDAKVTERRAETLALHVDLGVFSADLDDCSLKAECTDG